MRCDRRTFLESVGAGALVASAGVSGDPAHPGLQRGRGTATAGWRSEFPALAERIGAQPLAYLDSAATTLRPRAVIDAIAGFDARDNANPAAALHTLARRAATLYAGARQRVARFLGAADPAEIVFTKGTTEAINLVAATWGAANITSGDEIVLTSAEHYSNLLPWRALAARSGARIITVDVDDDGRVSPARIREALTSRTKLVAFSHVSNVLGLVNPAEDIGALAKARGVHVLIDAAQSAPHVPIDVRTLGCDFLACSSHKMLGPMGVGILWARAETLDGMPPYQLGSNMAHEVDATSAQYEHGALRYQAGTPNVSGAVGLAAALDVLERFGLDRIRQHDVALVEHAREQFRRIPAVQILGTMADANARVPLFTCSWPGVDIPRVVQALDTRGIAVRAGDMAALPLLRRFGMSAAIRASCYLYTTTEEIDRLVDVIYSLRS